MQYIIHSEARAEYLGAIAFYNERQPGLGARFTEEMEAAIQRILDWPMASPILEDGIRRCLTSQFPYGVLYEIEDDTVHIYAIMHTSRRPGFWRSRLEEDAE